MSFNQETEKDYVLFKTWSVPSIFPSALPIAPLPTAMMKVPRKLEYHIPMYHVMVGLLGFTASTAVAPIERVHLLIQNQNEMIKLGSLSRPYKGIKDCFLTKLKQDGFFSLWRGNCVNLSKAFTSQALAFAICKNSWHEFGPEGYNELGYEKYVAAICGATLIQYPLDYARTRLATDVEVIKRVEEFSLDYTKKNRYIEMRTWEFSGMFDVFRQTLLRNGFTGLYRGYLLSFVGFLTWHFTSKKIESQSSVTPPQERKKVFGLETPILVLHSLPVLLYPLTSVSRRMMMKSGEAIILKNKKNNTLAVVDTVKEMVKDEGIGCFYKGVTSGITHWGLRICAYMAVAPFGQTILHKIHFQINKLNNQSIND